MTDPVAIYPYDRHWPTMFVDAERELRGVLEPWVIEIEHVGSTSVPGLPAKPVIDIQVGVRSLDQREAIVDAMRSLDYRYVPEHEDEIPDRLYFRRSHDGRRSHQVHLVERSNHAWWDRHIFFRDWLRSHPADRIRYAELKERLAAEHHLDRRAYTDAKTAFIKDIEANARSGGRH